MIMAKIIIYRERYPFGSEEYNNADEHWHQVCFIEFIRLEYPQYYKACFAIPNGGTRNRVEAANMVMEGVKAGVPDVLCAFPMMSDHNTLFMGLYVEMKRARNSYGIREKQLEFMGDAANRGYAVALATGWHMAVGYFLHYVGMISGQEAIQTYGCELSGFAKGRTAS